MSLRVALVCDLLEEGWPSMDLIAEMLSTHLPAVAPEIQVALLRPAMRRRATRVPIAGRTRAADRLDRYSNRYVDYTRWLRARRNDADVFHVLDHSYAHLVRVLPAERTVVTCHDIDAFRCLTRPVGGGWYRPLAKHVLAGLRLAAMVTCDTRATRDDLVSSSLLPSDRLEVVHNGVHPAFAAAIDERARLEADRLIGPPAGIDLLHVSSVIPRKRIDVLLRVAAQVRARHPTLRLLRAGGLLTGEQRALARSLAIDTAVVELPFITPQVLAAVYERATLTLLPSDLEGFGLPMIESMSCGTPVLAGRIPALVEVGGDAAAYAPAGDVPAWTRTVLSLLRERDADRDAWRRRREAGRRRAADFTWGRHARETARLYARVAGGSRAAGVA